MMTEITRSELSEFASKLDVSERQLKRWRKHGLLPTPRRVGQGRGKGTVAYYPADVCKQLADLVRLKKRFRTLSDVGWALWSQGYDVVKCARERIETYLGDPTSTIVSAMEAFHEDRRDNVIQRSASRRLSPPFSTMRRRIGMDRMSTVAWHGFTLLLGEASERRFDPQGEGVFIEALAAATPIERTGISADEYWAFLVDIFSEINLPAILELLRESPDAAYIACRDEYRMGVDWLHHVGALPQLEMISVPLFVVWFCLRNWSVESREFTEDILRDFADQYRQAAKPSDE